MGNTAILALRTASMARPETAKTVSVQFLNALSISSLYSTGKQQE
jgi:hypothetical protein